MVQIRVPLPPGVSPGEWQVAAAARAAQGAAPPHAGRAAPCLCSLHAQHAPPPTSCQRATQTSSKPKSTHKPRRHRPGVVIGKRGDTVRGLSQRSGARIAVTDESVTVSGPAAAVAAAQGLLQQHFDSFLKQGALLAHTTYTFFMWHSTTLACALR